MRTITDTFGTVASLTAVTILAPWRMIPWRSTAEPIMKPGTSARKTSGMLKASHSQMKRAALSAESTNSVPARWAELLATIPTGWPSRRAEPDDQLPGEQRLDLEEAVAVDDAVDHSVHVERHPLVGRARRRRQSSTAGGSLSYTGGSWRHDRGKYVR